MIEVRRHSLKDPDVQQYLRTICFFIVHFIYNLSMFVRVKTERECVRVHALEPFTKDAAILCYVYAFKINGCVF